MADFLSRAERSHRMSRIRSRDTKPELYVRRALWARGIRYRLHARDLPGTPDIVQRGRKIAIFVNGCFWHAHLCQKGRIPGRNVEMWVEKFAANKKRDRRNRAKLSRDGWVVIVIWECQLSTVTRREKVLDKLCCRLLSMGRA